MSEEVLYYLNQLRKHDKSAYFSLVELDDACIPELINAFYQENVPRVQALLVEIIWQHRSANVLTFLQEALHHNHPDLWKTALDGIVAINDPQGIKILADEKARLQSLADNTHSERLAWIDEAYIQLQEGLDVSI